MMYGKVSVNGELLALPAPFASEQVGGNDEDTTCGLIKVSNSFFVNLRFIIVKRVVPHYLTV